MTVVPLPDGYHGPPAPAPPEVVAREAAGHLAEATWDNARQALRQHGTAVADARSLLPSAEQAVDRSGLPRVLDAGLAGTRGPARSLPWRTLLVGLVVSARLGHDGTAAKVHQTLLGLAADPAVARRLGLVRDGARWNGKKVTYRIVENALTVLADALDAGIAHADPATGEVLGPPVGADRFSDMLLEGSVPEDVNVTTGHWALDSTPYETWATRRSWGTKDALLKELAGEPLAEGEKITRFDKNFPKLGPHHVPQHTLDPDATEGHLPSKNGKEGDVFLGYDAHLAVPVRPHHKSRLLGQGDIPDVPPFVRRLRLNPANTSAGRAGRMLVESLAHDGLPVADVIADSKYTNSPARVYAEGIRALGGQVVSDHTNAQLKPRLRHTRGKDPHVMVQIGGRLFSSALPARHRKPRRFAPYETTAQKNTKSADYDIAALYAFSPAGPPDKRGSQRWFGPGRLDRVNCANRSPKAERLPPEVPRTACKKGDGCSCNVTVTVPADWFPALRQPQVYGTGEWRASYISRRVQVESFNAYLQGTGPQDIRRGYTRVFGRTKNTVYLTAALVAANLDRLDQWRAHQAAYERIRTDGGKRSHQRTPRITTQPEVEPVGLSYEPRPAPDDVVDDPG